MSATARLELEIAGLSRLRVKGMNVDMVLRVDYAAAYILHFDRAGNFHSWLLAVAQVAVLQHEVTVLPRLPPNECGGVTLKSATCQLAHWLIGEVAEKAGAHVENTRTFLL